MTKLVIFADSTPPRVALRLANRFADVCFDEGDTILDRCVLRAMINDLLTLGVDSQDFGENLNEYFESLPREQAKDSSCFFARA